MDKRLHREQVKADAGSSSDEDAPWSFEFACSCKSHFTLAL
jgi:hypothetical protein